LMRSRRILLAGADARLLPSPLSRPIEGDRMLRVGPTPMFHGVPVILVFDASIPPGEASRVLRIVGGLVRRMRASDATVDDLVDAIPPLLLNAGVTAELVDRTREVVKFSIRRTPRSGRSA
jgi:hypothetical protein